MSKLLSIQLESTSLSDLWRPLPTSTVLWLCEMQEYLYLLCFIIDMFNRNIQIQLIMF